MIPIELIYIKDNRLEKFTHNIIRKTEFRNAIERNRYFEFLPLEFLSTSSKKVGLYRMFDRNRKKFPKYRIQVISFPGLPSSVNTIGSMIQHTTNILAMK
ncbi:MAG: hypothetical protein K5989_05995 [Lachnospiraceae bacterium]|nr:hypothetical protein [Lachnospiraceae bacterium]